MSPTATDLRRRRQALGITQKELARRLAVSRQSINYWENEQAPIPRWVDDQLRWIEQAEARHALPKRRRPVKGERRGPYDVHKVKQVDNAG